MPLGRSIKKRIAAVALRLGWFCEWHSDPRNDALGRIGGSLLGLSMRWDYDDELWQGNPGLGDVYALCAVWNG